ncbi:MAG: shikimate kinase [Candidatus Dadabacteria bacterium]|nr:MAG: shikimate kinase [Candidatus Dadabacteria bacterium]
MADNVILVGLMGAGKSTVGRLLAKRLGWTFVDLDSEIEKDAGWTIPEIFAEEGEAGFRAREREAIAALNGRTGLVIATGGGAVVDPENRERLQALGPVFWLDVSPEIAAERTGSGSGRPLLSAEADPVARLTALLEARREAYADGAIQIDADGPAEAIVAAIMAHLPEHQST